MPTPTGRAVVPFSDEDLGRILKVQAADPTLIASREGSRLEFRETFSLGACKDKLKTFAAFANNQGGYLVFGVKDRPRRIVGLTGRAFADLEVHKLSGLLNTHFAPEVEWETYEYQVADLPIGLIYVHEARSKPVVCIRDCNEAGCAEGGIYYRYRGRSEAIKHAELRSILDEVRLRERDQWMKLISRIADIGTRNAAVLDTLSGEVTGRAGTFIIDAALLPKIAFVREGQFTETAGTPTLRLIGDVEPVVSDLVQPTRRVVQRTEGINVPEIISAFLLREEVPHPAEYIKAICYQTSARLPVWYYMFIGDLSKDAALQIIDQSQSTSQARRRLRDRLAAPTAPTAPSSRNPPVAGARSRILSESVDEDPSDPELGHVLKAIGTLEHNEANIAYLFPLLKRWFDERYGTLGSNHQSEFRKALCHLDTILYGSQIA